MRKITMDDFEWLVALGYEFNDKLFKIPLNDSKMRKQTEMLITNGVGFRTERGAIIGYYVDDPVRDDLVLVEMGWYCTDRQGIKLLSRFIEQAVEDGADEVRMSTLEANTAAKRILERKGFRPLETSHSLRLG